MRSSVFLSLETPASVPQRRVLDPLSWPFPGVENHADDEPARSHGINVSPLKVADQTSHRSTIPWRSTTISDGHSDRATAMCNVVITTNGVSKKVLPAELEHNPHMYDIVGESTESERHNMLIAPSWIGDLSQVKS
ncbi:hypothetical protein E4U43_000272 [Claviceps pusilla]|uniref:Uncharacterized protein n=1 Tax=Claviceps pusilla TaxID=123648 RepID=A0A9P7T067_9HYPO|nr:hypothetical protein E4U43_000272 [Claviceps pusilla]